MPIKLPVARVRDEFFEREFRPLDPRTSAAWSALDSLPLLTPRVTAGFRRAFGYGNREKTVTKQGFRFAAACLMTSLLLPASEVLPNGIELPAAWPPNYTGVTYEQARRDSSFRFETPMPVPYLTRPPAVIPIDLGRQLFVDDFLIANTDLRRTWHKAVLHPASPVLGSTLEWELKGDPYSTHEHGPRSMPFSDGVWWDEKEQILKMWYFGQHTGTGYAISRDGVRWEKPAISTVAGAKNRVLQHKARDSATLWLDHDEPDPARRYKQWACVPARTNEIQGNNLVMELRFSADGIRWSEPVWKSGIVRDRSSVYFNPFRGVWVYSVKMRPTVPMEGGERTMMPGVRSRAYREARDVLAPWDNNEVVPWMGADQLDPNRNDGIDRQVLLGQQMYNFDAVAYESVMLGLPSIFHGNGTGPRARGHFNDTGIAFSRDGYHWDRRNRDPFLPVGENPDDWNWWNIQPAGGGCLVFGDTLNFYHSGRNSPAESAFTGLATLRRDGFASMDADARGGILITRPVRFSGKYLFVNVNCAAGELKVAVLRENIGDQYGRTPHEIAPFTVPNCRVVRVDSTLHRVEWQGAADLSALSGRAVRFRFELKGGSLYSFWVSASESGASNGYVAAGGPGYPGNRDTVGRAAYTAAARARTR